MQIQGEPRIESVSLSFRGYEYTLEALRLYVVYYSRSTQRLLTLITSCQTANYETTW